MDVCSDLNISNMKTIRDQYNKSSFFVFFLFLCYIMLSRKYFNMERKQLVTLKDITISKKG